VSAQPPPTTMTPIFSWELSQLDAGSSGNILVTGLMAPDANFNDFLTVITELNSDSVELEMHNNEYEQIFQVGHMVFFPIIMK